MSAGDAGWVAAAWRKPCAEAYPAPGAAGPPSLLRVPITTASDGHRLGDVSWRISDLAATALAASYSEVTAFRGPAEHGRSKIMM